MKQHSVLWCHRCDCQFSVFLCNLHVLRRMHKAWLGWLSKNDVILRQPRNSAQGLQTPAMPLSNCNNHYMRFCKFFLKTINMKIHGVCFFSKRYYIPTSRQLRRIESTTRSPVFAHFGETVTGCSTIRAFRQQQRFTEHSEHLVDHNLVFQFATNCSNRFNRPNTTCLFWSMN